MGEIKENTPIFRWPDKNYILSRDIASDIVPSFCRGATYIYTKAALTKVLEYTSTVNIFRAEDVLFNGVVSAIAGVQQRNINGLCANLGYTIEMFVIRVACLLILVVGATSGTAVVCPKVQKAVGKLISADFSADIFNSACNLILNGTKQGTSFSNLATSLYNTLESQVLSLTAFYGPAMKLYTGLSDWEDVLDKAVTQIKKVCKPYYNNKLLKNKPASMTAMDKKIAGWIVKKVVRGAMLDVKGAIESSDWKLILTDLWTPIRFDANGFTKP
ncbi:unnamed protein product [Bursaphelenchus okinawaensis]|uniref:Uncharacterized protein n=1 Tax=Bursaphelenchus okinawaensis TaxID=465554 RepID=A0A811L172_9BILA|nr:unnamed protein product [Bursaphelenchus okinawaensis]CAG9115663.1 unnamed protein product [Bursaphelenchus okinawaensis]